MRVLILLHRWLGVAFCLLFAMWFASGIVMHFVPFPAFTEADRLAGLTPLDLAGVRHGPSEAIAAAHGDDRTRIQLVQRSDGPVYLMEDRTRTIALHASDLSSAAVRSAELALSIAKEFAARRHWDATAAQVAALETSDQWTVTGQYDRDRPLYRVALHDAPGTELYVSSAAGAIVLATTRRERIWNYAGSVAHWLYFAALRSHPAAWSRLLWWLSLIALVTASTGAAIGILRLGIRGAAFWSPYRGWQALHHWLGLVCMAFVLTWIFSGWLSMDDGMLFSTGVPSASEIAALTGAPDWSALPRDEAGRLDAQTVEVEWFAFGGRIYRRERSSSGVQRLALAGSPAVSERAVLTAKEIDALSPRLAPNCAPAFVVDVSVPAVPNAPVFRLVCGDDWFDIDAPNGVLLEKLDPSRRAYRWLFGGLHRLDFPVLTARPALRTALIVALCALGFVFSLTGVVVAWRRLLSCLSANPDPQPRSY
jgi:hypothetical protein